MFITLSVRTLVVERVASSQATWPVTSLSVPETKCLPAPGAAARSVWDESLRPQARPPLLTLSVLRSPPVLGGILQGPLPPFYVPLPGGGECDAVSLLGCSM